MGAMTQYMLSKPLYSRCDSVSTHTKTPIYEASESNVLDMTDSVHRKP